MSAFTPKSIWTAFVTAFFALLAALGLMSSPATATEQSVPEPATTNQAQAGSTTVTATAPSVRWTLPRDRTLPPTMKQRIRAEAHGSSPAARHVPADALANIPAAIGSARIAHWAAAGDTSLLPP
ncbi:DUF6344 domain-containing protein [Streptomyces sp. PTD5-9]|uniref:DUF6344 domain-containing protein n=1 Tax=Streptomyces sp. PTD5-9 TaxID=3120150 RepID=UPI0030089AD1